MYVTEVCKLAAGLLFMKCFQSGLPGTPAPYLPPFALIYRILQAMNLLVLSNTIQPKLSIFNLKWNKRKINVSTFLLGSSILSSSVSLPFCHFPFFFSPTPLKGPCCNPFIGHVPSELKKTASSNYAGFTRVDFQYSVAPALTMGKSIWNLGSNFTSDASACKKTMTFSFLP